jgi:hypothetical protein
MDQQRKIQLKKHHNVYKLILLIYCITLVQLYPYGLGNINYQRPKLTSLQSTLTVVEKLSKIVGT